MSPGSNSITGIILAGGKARRMGNKDKATLSINGERIIDRLITTIQNVTNNIIIISNTLEDYGYDFLVYADIYKEKGPIGGIQSGLSHSTSDLNLVLGCDMPFISQELIRELLLHSETADVIVPRHEEKIEPLCAIYRKKMVKIMEERIGREQYKMHDLLKEVDTEFVDIGSELPFYHSNLFANMNTPEDMALINKTDRKTGV